MMAVANDDAAGLALAIPLRRQRKATDPRFLHMWAADSGAHAAADL
jgi:hypothetical protein